MSREKETPRSEPMGRNKDGIQARVEGASKRVALVGLAKNCGKTTTLKHLLEPAFKRQERIGLVSIGVDGERRDFFSGIDKPGIWAPAGTLVATAQGLFERLDPGQRAQLTYVHALGFNTPLGPAIIGEVREAGHVILAGMRHRSDVQQAVRQMSEVLGADRVYIDGAYGRAMAAHPSICDGVILCTGAIVATKLSEVVNQTVTVVERLEGNEIEHPADVELFEASVEQNRALWGRRISEDVYEPVALPHASALVGLPAGRHLWTDALRAIAIPGVVSPRVVEELLAVDNDVAEGKRRKLLVGDGSAVQINPGLWHRLQRAWDIRVAHRYTILGVSYNPTRIPLPAFEDQEMRAALREALPRHWVFNPKKEA